MLECEYSTFDELPEIKGMDWEAAKMYHEDVDILYMLLIEYNKNISEYALQLENYCSRFPEKEAVDDFLLRIHSVKGTSAWVGAVHISEMARQLESYAKEQKLELIKEMLPLFLDEYLNLGRDLDIITKLKSAI